jgi:5-(carboxyamino)imidazole ribonucleotide mutase
MPNGIPVATVAINGAMNAGLLAVKILAAHNPDLLTQMLAYMAELTATSRAKSVGSGQ